MVREVVKKDQSRQKFDEGKISKSIVRAGKDTGEYGVKEAKKIVGRVMEEITKRLGKRKRVSVEEIRNIVEPAIAEAGYFGTAKYYIL